MTPEQRAARLAELRAEKRQRYSVANAVGGSGWSSKSTLVPTEGLPELMQHDYFVRMVPDDGWHPGYTRVHLQQKG